MNKKIKVLYIAGWGRSGSTLVGNILGSLPGFFHAGEVVYFWDRGVQANDLCACGNTFASCETWRAITRVGWPDGVEQAAGSFQARVRDLERLKTTQLVRGLFHARDEFFSQEFLQAWYKVYRAIADTTGCQVIVDGSKIPAFALAVSQVPDVELLVLHLVRDPRANAYSWTREMRYMPDGRFMTRINVLNSSLKWFFHNLAIQFFFGGRRNSYYRMRYEDFTAQPAQSLQMALLALGFSGAPLESVIQGQVAGVTLQHALSGNPVRFQHGPVEIKNDREWQTQLPFWQQWVSVLIVWPLMVYYRYTWKRTR